MSESKAVLAITTVASADDAATLVRGLLEQRLVACGSILPAMRSLYRWEGRIADESEALVLLKTTADRVADLKLALKASHPYQVPELLTFVAGDVLPEYLEWLASEVRPPA
ncbi:MAG TPA: divalent-cation tolerance protein CutA [Casimicrobiaceae bacterium]|nr:divalent-cation tolerance protein CutA [Casimicrobiaceae bacterium]